MRVQNNVRHLYSLLKVNITPHQRTLSFGDDVTDPMPEDGTGDEDSNEDDEDPSGCNEDVGGGVDTAAARACTCDTADKDETAGTEADPEAMPMNEEGGGAEEAMRGFGKADADVIGSPALGRCWFNTFTWTWGSVLTFALNSAFTEPEACVLLTNPKLSEEIFESPFVAAEGDEAGAGGGGGGAAFTDCSFWAPPQALIVCNAFRGDRRAPFSTFTPDWFWTSPSRGGGGGGTGARFGITI